ncbi:MAG: Inositol 1, 3, 4-trisphosphate 5/6-kinase [Promethearchaeota archaeon]|nr:MAG: Inositol 1, 3, 4-trisphosphate 5/6-kinase [Candidatus Lokiarchaeota archaeon]
MSKLISNRIYVGTICNRDLEVFEEIKKFCKQNYNIRFINLLKKGKFSLKYFKKKLSKYSISLLIVKLLSSHNNIEIYNALQEYAPHIPKLNGIDSVAMCESRLKTFKAIEQNCQKLRTPKTFYTLDNAYSSCQNGMNIIIKYDIHNAPYLTKEERIVGIADSPENFEKIINKLNGSRNKLFFQEYLGKFDFVYKVYVVDNWLVSITSKNRLSDIDNYTPLELIHLRVPVEKKLKRRIIRMGRTFNLPVFGIDYVLKEGKPYIVDVNDFPSFSSIPEAVSLISDFIYNYIVSNGYYYKSSQKVKQI